VYEGGGGRERAGKDDALGKGVLVRTRARSGGAGWGGLWRHLEGGVEVLQGFLRSRKGNEVSGRREKGEVGEDSDEAAFSRRKSTCKSMRKTAKVGPALRETD
jgi:hypothetical protein